MKVKQPVSRAPPAAQLDPQLAQLAAEASMPSTSADRRALIMGLGGVAAGAFLASSRTAQAGPIAPPSGPITSTGRTLSEIEPRTPITQLPFTITASGCYYLTGDLNTSSTGTAITVSTSGVTIDLNGFSLIGSYGATGKAISGGGSAGYLTVRNGMIKYFATAAIDVPAAERVTIENVTCYGTGAGGSTAIAVGDYATIRSCSVRSYAIGVNAVGGTTTLVEGCRVATCASYGIQVGNSSLVSGCALDGAGGAFGIQVGVNCVVKRCAIANFGTGVSAVSGTPQVTVAGCTIQCGNGIMLNDQRILVENCQVQSTYNGVRCGDSSIVRSCIVSNSSSTRSTFAGIDVGNISRVEDCCVFAYDRGILGDVTASIERCTVNNCNTAVTVGSYGNVSGCTLDFGTTGVLANGYQVRVVDNKISRFDPCVNCTSNNSTLVARNQFSETGANPVINNNATCAVGPMLGPNLATATNPWANIRI
ncbi:MAG: right-handed parallel beta-helix repeat-containing protein [Phycisphaerales bacterium]